MDVSWKDSISYLILSPLALTDAVAVSRAVNAYRAMSRDGVAKLAAGLNKRPRKISNIKAACQL